MIEAVPRILAEVRGRDDLHHALRARAVEVDISRPMIDHIAGLSSAYASKVLAADPLKGLTIDIAGLIAGALGCRSCSSKIPTRPLECSAGDEANAKPCVRHDRAGSMGTGG